MDFRSSNGLLDRTRSFLVLIAFHYFYQKALHSHYIFLFALIAGLSHMVESEVPVELAQGRVIAQVEPIFGGLRLQFLLFLIRLLQFYYLKIYMIWIDTQILHRYFNVLVYLSFSKSLNFCNKFIEWLFFITPYCNLRICIFSSIRSKFFTIYYATIFPYTHQH